MALRRAVPVVTVTDLPRAVAEYRAALGLEVLMDHGWIVTLGSGRDAQFSLIDRDATAGTNPSLSLEVDNVDAAHAAVASSRFEVVHPLSDEAWGVRRFFFRDRDGNVVNVLSHATESDLP
ncbi:MAG: VOC family protein [Solirubrobacterales bacterium]